MYEFFPNRKRQNIKYNGQYITKTTLIAETSAFLTAKKNTRSEYVLSPEEVEKFSYVVRCKPDAKHPLELKVHWSDRYQIHYCFYYKKTDGTWDDVSYKKALQLDPNLLKKGEVVDAFRWAVYPQTDQYRREQGYQNKTETHHVDHCGVNFKSLLDVFLHQRKLNLLNIEIDNFKSKQGRVIYKLKDVNLERQWTQFHRQHAKLQILTKAENLAKMTQDVHLTRFISQELLQSSP